MLLASIIPPLQKWFENNFALFHCRVKSFYSLLSWLILLTYKMNTSHKNSMK